MNKLNVVFPLPSLNLSLHKVSSPAREDSKSMLPTLIGIHQGDDYSVVTYLVISGNIKSEVPQLLNPESASTILQRRKI
jgi:hypothetical protein